MEIKISKDLINELKKVSENLGFDEEKIVERALLFYLNVIRNQLELNKEFNELDELSDEALVNFENSL
ncbi:MAG: hypothetical protein AABX84_03240 [Nanoarchaeota archaeon]